MTMYLVHDCGSFEALVSILKDGIVKRGDEVNKRYVNGFGDTSFVYTMTSPIYPDCKFCGGFLIYLKSVLLDNKPYYISKLWSPSPSESSAVITIKNSSSKTEHNQQLLQKLYKNATKIVDAGLAPCHDPGMQIAVNRNIKFESTDLVGIFVQDYNNTKFSLSKKKIQTLTKMVKEEYPKTRLIIQTIY